MSFGEIRRLYLIMKVFLTYGLDELIPQTRLTFLFLPVAPLCFLDP